MQSYQNGTGEYNKVGWGVVPVNRPGSVFIMDVSKSSSMSHPSRLTQYLRNTVSWILAISKLYPQEISLTHRFGDEVLLVARGFETAYVIAFYIMATWPFPKNPPYFGISYGDLLSDFPGDKDLETWNSPIVKRARIAADKLKKERSVTRQWLLFDDEGKPYREINELLNEYALIQDRFFKLQTEADHVASSLYIINDLQEWVASELNKNPSTISRQIRKSNVDILLTTKNRVVRTLHALMTTPNPQDKDDNTLTEVAASLEHLVDGPRIETFDAQEPWQLEIQIKKELKKQVSMFLSNIIQGDK